MFCVTGFSDGSDPDPTVHWVGDYLIIWSGIHTSRLNDSGRGKSLISSVRDAKRSGAVLLFTESLNLFLEQQIKRVWQELANGNAKARDTLLA